MPLLYIPLLVDATTIYTSIGRCHYYEEEENLGCTLGDWHPLAAEKLLAMAMHTGDDLQVIEDLIKIPESSLFLTILFHSEFN